MEFMLSSSSSSEAEISEDLVFALKNLYPSEHYRSFFKKLVRPNSRRISEYREIKMTSGLYSQSEKTYGSSLIQLGESKVACGITIMIGTPSTSTPKQGDIGFYFKYIFIFLFLLFLLSYINIIFLNS
jgi:exosome complex component RRP43